MATGGQEGRDEESGPVSKDEDENREAPILIPMESMQSQQRSRDGSEVDLVEEPQRAHLPTWPGR